MLGWDGGGQEVAVVEWNLGERGGEILGLG
jgi:hypothetical protein